MSHIYVDHIPTSDGQEESSSAEVQRTIDLILQHTHQKPQKSLGVITMGIKHAMRVQAALDQALSTHPELADFFDPGRRDRFFIKNLERVQGDERYCILHTVGYSKNRAGNLPLRFGPILSAGGTRRLNVAVTRARETMTIVSSFTHTDIDLTKVRPGTGLEFLRNYLQYAASQGTIFAHGELSNEPMNDFEVDIYEPSPPAASSSSPRSAAPPSASTSASATPPNPAASSSPSKPTARPTTPATPPATATAFASRCSKT